MKVLARKKIKCFSLIIMFIHGMNLYSYGKTSLPCGLSNPIHSSPFSDVSNEGKIEYIDELAKISLGEDLTIPFNINYRANNPSNSLILGSHCFFRPIDSKIMKTSENEKLMISPSGKLVNFRKSKTNVLTTEQTGTAPCGSADYWRCQNTSSITPGGGISYTWVSYGNIGADCGSRSTVDSHTSRPAQPVECDALEPEE